jgi:hypothetical protein
VPNHTVLVLSGYNKIKVLELIGLRMINDRHFRYAPVEKRQLRKKITQKLAYLKITTNLN